MVSKPSADTSHDSGALRSGAADGGQRERPAGPVLLKRAGTLRRRLGGIKAHVRRELRLAVHTVVDIGPKALACRLVPASARIGPTPRQRILRWRTPLNGVGSAGELGSYLVMKGIRFADSRHTMYIPPQPGLAECLGSVVDGYPENAGFKIVKRFAAPESAHYLIDSDSRWVTRYVIGGVERQADSANALYVLGIGPRLHDVTELSSDCARMTCFVVDHVAGRPPSEDDYQVFMRRLRQILTGDLRHAVSLMASAQLQSLDFKPPGCNGNLITRESDGKALYVDFQSFVIIDRTTILRQALRSILDHMNRCEQAHPLGSTSPPDVHRIVEDGNAHWRRYADLLARCRVSLTGRLVFDIGCCAGMTLAHALADGAHYGVGWDEPLAAAIATAFQSVIGNTRTEILPAAFASEHRFVDDLAPWVKRHSRDGVLFFRRRTLQAGLPQDIGTLPWTTLIHEVDDDVPAPEQAREAQVIEQMWRCRLVATTPAEAGSHGGSAVTLYQRD